MFYQSVLRAGPCDVTKGIYNNNSTTPAELAGGELLKWLWSAARSFRVLICFQSVTQDYLRRDQ